MIPILHDYLLTFRVTSIAHHHSFDVVSDILIYPVHLERNDDGVYLDREAESLGSDGAEPWVQQDEAIHLVFDVCDEVGVENSCAPVRVSHKVEARGVVLTP